MPLPDLQVIFVNFSHLTLLDSKKTVTFITRQINQESIKDDRHDNL